VIYDEANTDRDLTDWIARGILEIEQSLAHHADFDTYLATHKEDTWKSVSSAS